MMVAYRMISRMVAAIRGLDIIAKVFDPKS
jgi:hypothetical protein